MAKQTINIGTTANDGTGDAIRAAFGKVNDNFTEIYTANTGVNTGDQNLSAYATTAAVAAGYQPLDSDLTAISALTTTAYGRALLSTADAATLRSAIGVGTTDAPTFLAQTLTGQSLTGTQATSLVDLSATWNTTGTPSALKLNVTDTASNAASKLLDLQVGGVSKFNVGKTGHLTFPTGNAGPWIITGQIRQENSLIILNSGGLFMSNTNVLRWSESSNAEGGIYDLYLTRDAPGILAQRNGTSAQAFRVYNTTDGTNTEYGSIAWIGGAFEIGSKAAGTGATRHTKISSVNRIYLNTGGTDRWSVETTGHLLAGADNTYDIGATTANRPANINAASSVRGEYFSMTSGLTGVTRSYLVSPSAGVVTLFNSAGNGFTRLELGTVNLGISRGTGSPEGVVTALVGSLYIRTDGGASTTLYVKESSPTPSTGWVAK